MTSSRPTSSVAPVFQGILSSLDYHRWHSPVQGRTARTYVVPGTFYAAMIRTRTSSHVLKPVTAISTRAVIFIQADRPYIDLMCFVGVGLGEISTSKIDVKEGDCIKKGDGLGSFHFGGSTHLLMPKPN